MVTAYDATAARLLDRAGIDALLVGDSVGMVVQGHEDTLKVTVDDIIYHTRAVQRGAQWAHVVADMPFMSYHTGIAPAVENAGRLVKDGGAESVKLEGGAAFAEVVRAIVDAGIPVMGHVGLMPQRRHAMGGFKVQGREAREAEAVLRDARAIEAAGAFALVLEGIPAELGRVVTQTLSIPTIGIGAGPDCDGQVLVLHDLVGLNTSFTPKFVKRYAEQGTEMVSAAERFRDEVQAGSFPTAAHCYKASGPLFGPRPVSNQPGDDDEDVSGLYGVPV